MTDKAAFDLLADLLWANSQVCHPVVTAGLSEMCGVHKWPWPCRYQWQVTRQELITALRHVAIDSTDCST